MKFNDLSLQEAIDLMKRCNDKGFDTYFEGRGNGKVSVIAEAVFIVKNGESNVNGKSSKN
jgi:hypothetical protein